MSPSRARRQRRARQEARRLAEEARHLAERQRAAALIQAYRKAYAAHNGTPKISFALFDAILERALWPQLSPRRRNEGGR